MNNYIKTLFQLVKENPELDVITMTDYEVCCSDKYRYWKGEIEEVRKDIYYETGEKIVIGENEIKDELLDEYEQIEYYNQFPAKGLLEKVEFEFETTNYKEAIFIFIGV